MPKPPATSHPSDDNKIHVVKTFMPPIEEYEAYVRQIWQSGQLTNQGPLRYEFEQKIETFLGVKNFHFVSNGTLALQIALRALNITEGEVITTPFTYVATTSSILWEHCKPIFVDIDPVTFCIDANKIEAAITDRTRAIMPVHVFGIPCDVEKIQAIADKHNLKVIYDAAHAFGVEYKGKTLLRHGDISVCSFHATKSFHTIEGGGLVVKDDKVSEEVELIKRFGHTGDEHFRLGINGKASEFQAAMGLVNLSYVKANINARREIVELYDRLLDGAFTRPRPADGDFKYNYSYYPIVIESESRLHEVVARLSQSNIYPRRYFYPSLNTLPYIENPESCPIAEDIATRVLCLPLYLGLEPTTVKKICELLTS